MDWKEYEKEIYNYFQQSFPETTISYDKKIIGRFSKVERQIDILIEGSVADYEIKIVVDCKYFSDNIDVKEVESFCSMVDDIGAHQGILITRKGYSQAAINRAYYGNNKIELDCINFDEIQDFQSLAAIPYIEHFSVFVPAPFGWVADLNDKINSFATLHQRGLSLKEARQKNEWMYMEFWKMQNSDFDIDQLIEFQNRGILEIDPKTVFNYMSSVRRKDGFKTKIRIAEIEGYPAVEVTGFIQFEKHIFFVVLFTPKELLNKNIRKLQYLLKVTFPQEIKFNNHDAIQGVLNEISETNDKKKQADGYYQIGIWYEEMDDVENALANYRKAIKCFPAHYSNLKGIIGKTLSFGLIEDSKRYTVQLFEIEPTNPRVPQDLIEIYFNLEKPKILINLFEELISQKKDSEVLGNLNFHLGLIYLNLDNEPEKVKYMQIAKQHFSKFLPPGHQVFKALAEFEK